jgi:hypothetical protein
MICKNCEGEFEGNFCNYCGQKATVGRLSFTHLITEVPITIFKVNRGFLFTVKELALRPGHSIRDYISGKRAFYYKPVAFLLVTTTLYALSFYLLDRNTVIGDIVFGFQTGIEEKQTPDRFQILSWITQNQAYFVLVMLCLFSAASYLVFQKSRNNYVEHLVLNIYITGQQMLIFLLLGLLIFQEGALMVILLVVNILYNIWAYSQFFAHIHRVQKYLLIFLVYVVFFILFLMTVFIATMIYHVA